MLWVRKRLRPFPTKSSKRLSAWRGGRKNHADAFLVTHRGNTPLVALLKMTQAKDEALAEIGHEGHGFVRSAGRRVLRSSEW